VAGPCSVKGIPWKLLSDSTGELLCEPASSQKRKDARQVENKL